MKKRGAASGEQADHWWFIALALIAGIAYPLSQKLAGGQDGDGVLTSLISTQRLTWYFWGQDRILNLLPAVASPFHDLDWNLHVQLFLRALTTFVAPVGILVLLSRQGKTLVMTAAAGLVVAASCSDYALFNLYVQHNPFSPSLVLFALAVMVAEQPWKFWLRISCALAICFLAYTVNIALIVLTVPLLVLCMLFGVRDTRWLLVFLALQAGAAVLAVIHAKLFGEPVTSFALQVSSEAVKAGWSSLGQQIRLGWLAALLLVSIIVAAWRHSRSALLAMTVACGMPIAVTVLSCTSWLQRNSYDVRYYLMFLITFSTCCVYILLEPVLARFGSAVQRIFSIACVWAVFSLCLGGIAEHPNALIAPRWRAQSEQVASLVDSLHAQLIVGDFWDVWPATFAARERSRENGDGETAAIYGIAFRGHVLRSEIQEQMREKGKLTAVCFQDDVAECLRTTNMFVMTDAPVTFVPGSVRTLSVAGRTVLAYDTVARTQGGPGVCIRNFEFNSATPHQIGSVQGTILSSEGKEGFLLFGPYQPVTSGNYQIELFGEVRQESGSWLDISGEEGKRSFLKVELHPNSRGRIVDASVDLPDVSDLEVRVWSAQGDQVALRGYRLKSTSSDASACAIAQ